MTTLWLHMFASVTLECLENVPAVVNIKTLKGRFIAHKFLRARGNGTIVLTLLSEFVGSKMRLMGSS